MPLKIKKAFGAIQLVLIMRIHTAKTFQQMKGIAPNASQAGFKIERQLMARRMACSGIMFF